MSKKEMLADRLRDECEALRKENAELYQALDIVLLHAKGPFFRELTVNGHVAHDDSQLGIVHRAMQARPK